MAKVVCFSASDLELFRDIFKDKLEDVKNDKTLDLSIFQNRYIRNLTIRTYTKYLDKFEKLIFTANKNSNNDICIDIPE